jgi:hypothetical protein
VHTSLNELRINLYRAAQEHHRTGARYYAALEKSSKEKQKIAAEQYKASAELYLSALSSFEQSLLSIERDKEMELELIKLQTRIHAVEVVLKYL